MNLFHPSHCQQQSCPYRHQIEGNFLKGLISLREGPEHQKFLLHDKGANSWLLQLPAKIVSHPLTVSNDLYTLMGECKRYLSNRSTRKDIIHGPFALKAEVVCKILWSE